MSAGYINRNIMKYMYKTKSSDFYYKNAAIDARSPENEADLIERAFLKEAKKIPDVLRRSDVVDFNGKPFFIYMRTNTSRIQEVCLRCHSTPDKASADLIKLYGSKRSFGKKVGDTVSVLSVRIPLDSVYSSINTLTVNLFILLCGFAGFFFVVQFLITRKNIVSPLNQITKRVLAISKNDSLLGEKIVSSGKDELKELAEAFSIMSKRVDIELISDGGVQQYESQVKTANGELRDVLFSKAAFLDNKGTVRGLIGTILDITERKKAEQEAFSHSICNECAKKYYPDLDIYDE